MREPTVLRVDPLRGWGGASRTQKTLALLIPLYAAYGLAYTAQGLPEGQEHTVANALVSTLGLLLLPPAAHALARIIRPHPEHTSTSRRARHWASAVAAGYGLGAVLWLSDLERGAAAFSGYTAWLYVLAAASLGPTTILWGTIEAAARPRRPGAQQEGGNTQHWAQHPRGH